MGRVSLQASCSTTRGVNELLRICWDFEFSGKTSYTPISAPHILRAYGSPGAVPGAPVKEILIVPRLLPSMRAQQQGDHIPSHTVGSEHDKETQAGEEVGAPSRVWEAEANQDGSRTHHVPGIAGHLVLSLYHLLLQRRKLRLTGHTLLALGIQTERQG